MAFNGMAKASSQTSRNLTSGQLADMLNDLDASMEDVHQPPDAEFEQAQQPEASEDTTNYPCRRPHHELHFNFPATALLSNPQTAYMPEPHLVDWRPEPDTADFLAPEELNLFHILNPVPKAIDISHIDSEPAAKVFTAIDDLASSIGKTWISVVIHETNGAVEVRLKITTDTLERKAKFKSVFFDLSVDDWGQLMAIDRPWVHILSDVVYRKTARSYLAARQKMKRECKTLKLRDTKAWFRRWGSKEARSARELFEERLRVPRADRITRAEDSPLGPRDVQLPCGHIVAVSEQDMLDVTQESCKTLTCDICGALILRDSDFEEAKLYGMNMQVKKAAEADDGWTRLDEELHHIKDAHRKTFYKKAVLLAIPAALQSLQMPELLESKHMSALHFEETSTAWQAMERWLNTQPEVMSMTPWQLFRKLEHMAILHLEETSVPVDPMVVELPPGWREFLKFALNRAVNLALLRRCSKLGEGHEGVHWHGNMVYVSTTESGVNTTGSKGSAAFSMKGIEEALDMDVDMQ